MHEALPFWWLRLAAALLLSAMGIHWSVKSARRLLAHRRPRWMEDPLGKVNVAPVQTANAAFSPMVFLVMGKSSVVEAAEILLVVFPVAAATGARWEVVWGVAAGIAVVSIGAALLHGQLKKVPEVGLKLAVGLLLATLGLSWIVELLRDSV